MIRNKKEREAFMNNYFAWKLDIDAIMCEVVQLQVEYEKLCFGKSTTQKEIFDLCMPFRDKHNMTDSQALSIARNEYSIAEIVRLVNKRK